ncbi:Calcium-independent receptor for alpha-latrotoxin [Carabus blaptoides fortunei]
MKCILTIVLICTTLALSQDIQTKIACQHDTLHLRCNRGEHIQITSSNYGRTNVYTCGLEGDTECHSTDAINIVKQRCDKLQSCSIKATNEVFGEPCVGVIKYLEVSYKCTPEHKCKQNELVCHDGTCIRNTQICNGHADCNGGEDERDCQ